MDSVRTGAAAASIPFNPVKFRILGQPIDETIGNSDMVPLWNLDAARRGTTTITGTA